MVEVVAKSAPTILRKILARKADEVGRTQIQAFPCQSGRTHSRADSAAWISAALQQRVAAGGPLLSPK